jgi:hypothetical protein
MFAVNAVANADKFFNFNGVACINLRVNLVSTLPFTRLCR